MIQITNNTQPSTEIAAKAKRVWIRQIRGQSAWCVVPKGRWGTKRRVTLLRAGNRLQAHCENYYDGTPCPANLFNGLCYSVWKVIDHLEKKAQRESRQAA